MSLAQLFAACNQLVFSRHGKGVSAESVKLVELDGSETEILNFVFEDTTSSEGLALVSGNTDDRLGELELPRSYVIRDKTSFRIDGDIWQVRGRGGSDANRQTILIQAPKETAHRGPRARGT